jgi:hypothetical protein
VVVGSGVGGFVAPGDEGKNNVAGGVGLGGGVADVAVGSEPHAAPQFYRRGRRP